MSRLRHGDDHHPQDAHNPPRYRTRSNNVPVDLLVELPKTNHLGTVHARRPTLTIDQVNVIRRCAAGLGRGRYALLARAFGVSPGQVRNVVRGRR